MTPSIAPVITLSPPPTYCFIPGRHSSCPRLKKGEGDVPLLSVQRKGTVDVVQGQGSEQNRRFKQRERRWHTCTILCCLTFKLTNLAIVITRQSPDIVNLPREMLQLRVGMRVARGSWHPTLETLFSSATVYCVVKCVCQDTTRTRIDGWELTSAAL